MASRTTRPGFDFCIAMQSLCVDVTNRLEVFQHIHMDQVLVTFAQTRRSHLHGLQAKLTPLRFEGGSLTQKRHGRLWTIPRLHHNSRECLYILTFYLPRFQNQSFREKMITVLHELYHISPDFNGDIRRMSGRYHVHTHSQQEYDRLMGAYVDEYLHYQPPQELFAFLKENFAGLQQRFGSVIGLKVPIPKLIPAEGRRSA